MRELGKRFRTKVVPGYPGSTALGEIYWFWNNKWQSATQTLAGLGAGSQIAKVPSGQPFTKGEYCWDDLHPGPPWRSGGPFSKVTVDFPFAGHVQGIGWHEKPGSVFHNPWVGFVPTAWKGGFVPSGLESFDALDPVYGNVSLIMSNSSLAPDPTAWGPEAWDKSAPRIEMASGFVALAEAKDLPRMLQQTAEGFHESWKAIGGNVVRPDMAPKKAAGQFLNIQFGWMPFLSDIGKFYRAFNNTASYMSRMSHGNDKWKVYRRTLLDDFERTKIYSGTDWKVIPFGQFVESHLTDGQPPSFEVWEEKSTHVTSSGRFKWYKPEFDRTDPGYDNPLSAINRQMTMYGARISPSNIWRATPWTWLVDWGANVGRNIDRLTETLLDGVVSEYLYVMAQSTRTLRFIQTIPFASGPLTLEFTKTINVKQRQAAGSPYGFDSPWESLSPMRLAILGALGLSRRT